METKQKEEQSNDSVRTTRLLGTREIKFRAWDEGNSIMCKPDGNGYFYSDFAFVIDGDGQPIYLHDMNTPEGIILMQFTGLKDKNGKEIYEGDITPVKIEPEEFGRLQLDNALIVNGYFRYNKHQCCYEVKLEDNPRSVISVELGWADEEFEVIGNIFENPELIECT